MCHRGSDCTPSGHRLRSLFYDISVHSQSHAFHIFWITKLEFLIARYSRESQSFPICGHLTYSFPLPYSFPKRLCPPTNESRFSSSFTYLPTCSIRHKCRICLSIFTSVTRVNCLKNDDIHCQTFFTTVVFWNEMTKFRTKLTTARVSHAWPVTPVNELLFLLMYMCRGFRLGRGLANPTHMYSN